MLSVFPVVESLSSLYLQHLAHGGSVESICLLLVNRSLQLIEGKEFSAFDELLVTLNYPGESLGTWMTSSVLEKLKE